jgi:hypothetical protein
VCQDKVEESAALEERAQELMAIHSEAAETEIRK